MTEPKIDYEAILERLHGEEPITGVGEPLQGEAAAAAGRAMLLGEYGSDKAIARAIRTGRPRVGEAKRGPSPTVRGRIAEHDYAALAQLEERTGKSESALVREAVHMLLQKYQVAS